MEMVGGGKPSPRVKGGSSRSMTIWFTGNRALLASFLGARESPRQHRSSMVIDRSWTFFRRSQISSLTLSPV